MKNQGKWQEHTFIILAYKESKYLNNCIESILNQNITSNIIITSSTSSNFLQETARKYNIQLLINPTRNGIASDWDFAYQIAQSSYVTLVHQDDIYMPDYLNEVYCKIKKYPDFLIIFSDYFEIFNSKIRKRSTFLKIKKILLYQYFFKKAFKSFFFKKLLLRFGNPICCPTITFNKNQLPKNFQFDPNYRTNLDWDAWLRMANMNGKFVFINRRLLGHRIHEDAETTLCIKENKRKEEDFLLFKRLWPTWIAKLLLFFYKKSYNNIH